MTECGRGVAVASVGTAPAPTQAIPLPLGIDPRRRSILAAVVCGALLIGYASIAWLAAAKHSPTYDEPNYALAAQIALRDRDYRINFENPPLWDYLVALPGAAQPLRIDPPGSLWAKLPGNTMLEWPYTMSTVYRTPGNDPDALIGRSRIVCLALAVACGAGVALWAFRLRGAVAAVVATSFFALDPNLLAHGPLVKNDVVAALVFAVGAMLVWRVGRQVTVGNLLALGAVCVAACTCKLSGVLLPPILVALLFVRALRHEPWRVFGRSIDTRLFRLLAVVGMSLVMLVMTIGGIWAVYGFRFSAIPGGPPLAAGRLFATLDSAWHAAGHPGSATDHLPARFARVALDHHLLPEAFVDGGLYIYATTLDRPGFLLGDVRRHGWWDYYPLTIAFKFPLATSLATVLAFLQLCRAAVARRRQTGRSSFLTLSWTTGCLLFPPVVYLLLAMNTATAVGIRHLFPIFPALLIAIGCAAAAVWPRRSGKVVVCATIALLAIESIAVYPNYISFFNVIAGGSRGGIKLLADSNLDWGQDLPALAVWRRVHPGGELYLSYFGTADPGYYGIRYHNLPGGYLLGPPAEWPPGPGYVAVSATNLQGVNATPTNDFAKLLSPLQKIDPVAVIGGSIYVYRIR